MKALQFVGKLSRNQAISNAKKFTISGLVHTCSVCAFITFELCIFGQKEGELANISIVYVHRSIGRTFEVVQL